jgi:hypothetical protein
VWLILCQNTGDFSGNAELTAGLQKKGRAAVSSVYNE